MNKIALPLLLSCVLLAACGPDQIVADLPSPNGRYHVEVRKCPQSGALTWSEKLQVSVLEPGQSAECQSAVNPLVQFDTAAPENQLQLEWLSDHELRAWHPDFTADAGPAAATYKHDVPVKLVFMPKALF